MSSATYRTLLRAPGAASFFLTSAVGRVGIAMTSLGIVWLVHARTGSYATAGLVTGGFAVAEAVAGPQLARLIDRFGQSRVLPPALLAHAAAVATLLALVAAGSPDWLMTAGGVLAGATIPQLGALSAARWAALLRDERPRRCLPRLRWNRWPTSWPTWPVRPWSASSAPAGTRRPARCWPPPW